MKSKPVPKNIELNYHNPLAEGLISVYLAQNDTLKEAHFPIHPFQFGKIEALAQEYLDSTNNSDCKCDFCKRAKEIIELCKF